MPSLKAIRRRIASVKSTQKITKAMKMVAAARLRRAQQAILELRPYAVKTAEVLGSVSQTTGEGESLHPLLTRRTDPRHATVVVLTSDRGLAGAFNANIVRMVDRRMQEISEADGAPAAIEVATIGRRGRDYYRRRNVNIVHDFPGAFDGGPSKIALRAHEIARQLIEDFVEGRTDQVYIAFSEFRSAISQKPRMDALLPVQPVADSTPADTKAEAPTEYLFEPDRAALLEQLLPMYVAVTVQRAMLESLASEHGARMTAMDSATKNASEMIDSLTLQYNRARQAAITKELMEIIGGAEALKDA